MAGKTKAGLERRNAGPDPVGVSRPVFILRIATAVVLGLAVAAVIYAGFGRDKASMFGPAAGALAAVPVLSAAMRDRARRIGDRPWLRFLSLAPLVIWALAQIGFWALFLSSRDGAIMAGMSLNAARAAAAQVLPALYWAPFVVLGVHCLSLLLGRDKGMR
jgi:hypothetical protein